MMIRRSWSDGKTIKRADGGTHWLYDSKRWRLHRLSQLRKHPLCEKCMEDNVVKAARVAHHVIDHKGDPRIFFTSPLMSLCKECHDSIEYGSKHHGCDVNGKPYKTKPIYIDKNKMNAGRRGHENV
jgi:5-methylcytosine-specific restriction protein A